jgi:DNA-binding response OmpR family regulator
MVDVERPEARNIHKDRQPVPDEGLRLEFAEETKSLKHVDVPSPKARILAVDDEPVVLDSFRKILTPAGFSVDTVETGQEALSLVRKNDYQFVFTDLKMPGMDGVDVTRAVKHLCADIDVAIITGYGTIQSAVSAMQFGAVDYVEKPFTEDELVEFANRLLIRRQDRLARLAGLEIHLITPAAGARTSPRVINVPGGVYVSPEHTWVSVEVAGDARVGLDDLVHKTVGEPDSIALPQEEMQVRRGQALFTIRRGDRALTFRSPLSGRVSQVNHDLEFKLALMGLHPYDLGWICVITPSNLTSDLAGMTLGAASVAWYQSHVEGFRRKLAQEMGANRAPDTAHTAGTGENVDAAWNAFGSTFLGPETGIGALPSGAGWGEYS